MKATRMKALILAACACLLLPFAAQSSAAVTIKFAHMNSPKDKVHRAAEMIKAGVEERTAGAVKIQLFPSGQLGENKDVLEQARLGSGLMGQFGVGHLGEYVPNFSLFLHPFLFNSWDEAKKLLASDLIKGWEKQLEDDFGIIVLGYGNFGVRDFYTLSKPIRTPADTRGMGIRVQPVKMYTEMIAAIGASAQTLPWMEVYSALSQKVIDGAEAPPSSMLDQKHNEIVKYMSITEHMLDVVPFATSAKVFNSLSAEQQQILREETIKALEWMSAEVVRSNDELINQIEASGVTIIRDVDKDAFREATKNISKAFPEWTPGIYDQAREIIAK